MPNFKAVLNDAWTLSDPQALKPHIPISVIPDELSGSADNLKDSSFL